MAFRQLTSIPLCTFTKSSPPGEDVSLGESASFGVPATATKVCDQTVVRRSGNYQPCLWDYDYVQSLTSVYVGEKYARRAEKLKGDVRMMLDKVLAPLDQLELIDVMQRLGVSYHFKDEIERILDKIYITHKNNDMLKKEDLYATALEFRLLRQHGYHVPQEVFDGFKDEMGNFKACLCKDTKGLLCLYEASYLSIEGESTLEEAKNFTARHLKENLGRNIDQNLDMQVCHALELPLHWRMLRLETRWFIDVYERRLDMNPILLEHAKLDFNMVQATHQEELKHMSRWWRNMGLAEMLSFSRDRLMESFFWAVGLIFEPQFGNCRRMCTKLTALITTIDDTYDVYGTLDELELFTDAIERWDINAMEQLPDYMKICFLAVYNSINEMAYDAFKEHGSYIISYLKKAWAELCRSYFVEAKWYYSEYTPTLREYLDNAWISIAVPAILVHIYFSVTKPITKEALECLERCPSIIRWSSIVVRLLDDLGTSYHELKRGDVPKSIQCYMLETGASEEDARDHIRCLIGETWKKVNEARVADSPLSETFIGTAKNAVRMAHCMYQYGDGHGVQDCRETKDYILSLFIEPIPLI